MKRLIMKHAGSITGWICCLFFLCTTAYGAQISRITFEGMTTTSPVVLAKVLGVSEGDDFDPTRLQEGVQHIRNFQIFEQVTSRIQETESGVEITVTVKDRWTLIPALEVRTGGGSEEILSALYEANLGGKLLELGVFVESINGEMSYGSWFEDKFWMDRPALFYLEAGSRTRVRTLYGDNAAVFGGYRRTAFQMVLRLEFENENRDRMFGGGFRFRTSTYSISGLKTSLTDANTANGFTAPAPNTLAAIELTGKFGRLNYTREQVQGSRLALLVAQASPAFGASEEFASGSAVYSAFSRHGDDLNLGMRLEVAATGATHISNQIFVGGLTEVRGFRDAQFRGAAKIQLNSEARLTVFRHPWAIVQGVAFFDAGNVGRIFADQPFYSAGLGFRIKCPKIYRSQLRVDYGFGFGRQSENSVVIGLGQFF
jgi:outer membrane protein assembly factor BamA